MKKFTRCLTVVACTLISASVFAVGSNAVNLRFTNGMTKTFPTSQINFQVYDLSGGNKSAILVCSLPPFQPSHKLTCNKTFDPAIIKAGDTIQAVATVGEPLSLVNNQYIAPSTMTVTAGTNDILFSGWNPTH